MMSLRAPATLTMAMRELVSRSFKTGQNSDRLHQSPLASPAMQVHPMAATSQRAEAGQDDGLAQAGLLNAVHAANESM